MRAHEDRLQTPRGRTSSSRFAWLQDAEGGRFLPSRSARPWQMELAGLEPATSWVRSLRSLAETRLD
jgi:hypothetical protein